MVCAAMPCTQTRAQAQYFVDPVHGKDRQDGTCRHPFKTLERACREAAKASGETTVYLRQGRHALDKTLVLTSAVWDGTANRRLHIMSYPGERATVTGGKTLRLHWIPYRNGIMKADVHGQATHIDMLTADGSIRPMARYPNYDPAAVRFGGTAADAIAPERVSRWEHPEGGFLHAMHLHDWGDFHYRITGKDANGGVTLEGGWQNNRQMGLHPQNRMVENIFEELDAPGEWYYDKGTDVLYYYPVPGEDVAKTTFETPQLKHLIELRGSVTRPVCGVSIADITFTLTDRTFMEHYEPLLRSDWTVYRGGAVVMEGTRHCHISRCDLHNLGGNAVFFSGYNRHSSVSGTHFSEIGASAVCFVGDTSAVRSPAFEYNISVPIADIDRTPGPKNDRYPEFCSAYDNLIHDIGLFEKQTTGVELSMCRHITVSHNSIYHTPRAGINVSEGTWGGHVIEHNDVFDNVRETGDHGAFNSWGRDRYWRSNTDEMRRLAGQEPGLVLADATACTTIRHNRLRCDRGWDIDLDDGSSNYRICDNLCLNGGIKLREGFYRVVENNVLINGTFHPHVWFKDSGDVFARNLVMAPYAPIWMTHWGAEVDYNVFTDSTAYNTARKCGTDAHAVVSKVQFADPAHGDYRVADVARLTALCGFRNIDTDNFGVVSPRLKAIAETPLMPHPSVMTEETKKTLVVWSGLTLKDLDTPGERSATGMDEERGVYVVEASVMGNKLRDFVRANDVLLAFGGQATDNLGQFRDAVAHADLTKPVALTIFREQRRQTVVLPAGTVEAMP